MSQNNTTKEDKDVSFLKVKEQLVEKARQFNLLSNVFLSVALKDIPACQHVIQIITGIRDLTVKEVRTQYRISKVTAHDAILDVLAEDGQGRLVNLEIQRKETIDHARRSRFYAAMIDSECLEKGKEYYDMPEVYIIYISETDLWKAGKALYQVEKLFKETQIAYDDGIHVLYANAAVDDGSDIAKLMHYFRTADSGDMSQGDLSARVHFLKCEEGGYREMCEVSEEIYNVGLAEGETRGETRGEMKKAREVALSLFEKGMSAPSIAETVQIGLEIVEQWLSGTETAKP